MLFLSRYSQSRTLSLLLCPTVEVVYMLPPLKGGLPGGVVKCRQGHADRDTYGDSVTTLGCVGIWAAGAGSC